MDNAMETYRNRGPIRVLIVDDQASNRVFAERVLRAAGYAVEQAGGGPEALRMVEEQGPFDLFVVDVMMPDMSGIELSRTLRQSDPESKILYYTANSDWLFENKNVLWANEAFVDKPVSLEGLREAVSLMLFGHIQGPGRDT